MMTDIEKDVQKLKFLSERVNLMVEERDNLESEMIKYCKIKVGDVLECNGGYNEGKRFVVDKIRPFWSGYRYGHSNGFCFVASGLSFLKNGKPGKTTVCHWTRRIGAEDDKPQAAKKPR